MKTNLYELLNRLNADVVFDAHQEARITSRELRDIIQAIVEIQEDLEEESNYRREQGELE